MNHPIIVRSGLLVHKGGEMASQLASMWPDNMSGTDVVLRVANSKIQDEENPNITEVKCHKFILAARSPVFETMFTIPMKEKATNIVHFPTIHPDTLMVFLKFIYTGRVDPTDVDMALLDMANQYDIGALHDYCALVMCRHLTIKNAVNIYLAAMAYRSNSLAQAALDFITIYFPKVRKTKDWKQNQGAKLSEMFAHTLSKRPRRALFSFHDS
jgi:hypothetical protein